MPYIYSTLSAPVKITFYRDEGGKHPVSYHAVMIPGGANIASKHLITPKGVASHVTESDLELLETHPNFQIMKTNGFIKIDKKKSEDLDKAVKDLAPKDRSAPKTPEDYAETHTIEDGKKTTLKSKKVI